MSRSSIKQLEHQLVLEKQLYQDRINQMKAKHGIVSKKLCKHFTMGLCKFGDKCRFRHDEQDAEKARAQRDRLEQARLKRESDLALVANIAEKPRTLTATYDKTQSVSEIMMCRQIVSAMDDSAGSIEKKNSFLALCSTPFTITFETLDKIVSMEKELVAYSKVMFSTYIREKYQMDPSEYYSIWLSTCHMSKFEQASGDYYSVKIDQDYYVTTISPRDDVLIAAYACGKAIEASIVKCYYDWTRHGN